MSLIHPQKIETKTSLTFAMMNHLLQPEYNIKFNSEINTIGQYAPWSSPCDSDGEETYEVDTVTAN